VRLHVEKAQFEHGEQPARAGADDENVCLYCFRHTRFLQRLRAIAVRVCLAGAAGLGKGARAGRVQPSLIVLTRAGYTGSKGIAP
jgi:hypothetical protein